MLFGCHPTSKQTKEQLREGWGLDSAWLGVFLPSVTQHDHIVDRELQFREKQFHMREN